MRIRAIREGAVEFLAKPFDHHLLLKRSVLHLICEQPRLLQSIAGTCNSLPGHAALTFHNTCRFRGGARSVEVSGGDYAPVTNPNQDCKKVFWSWFYLNAKIFAH